MRGVFGKKGASHFEMIISFVFFIGFVFFLIVILKPYEVTDLSDSAVVGLHNSFAEEVSTNLTTISLSATFEEEPDCFSIDLVEDYGSAKSFVRRVEGGELAESVDSEIVSGGDLEIEGGSGFYSIMLSSEFNSGTVVGDCASNGDYVFGSIIERQMISYEALESLKEENYETLRERLDVPEVFDFAIVSAEFPEINMERNVPDVVEVVAKDYILPVLDRDGEIVNSRFTFRVW